MAEKKLKLVSNLRILYDLQKGYKNRFELTLGVTLLKMNNFRSKENHLKTKFQEFC